MITLADFQKYDALEQELKAFLVEKVKEYNEAKGYSAEKVEDLTSWKFQCLEIVIWFGVYTYKLPLDLLFDPDFKTKIKVRFEEEREKERLRLIEKRKQHEEEFKRLTEKKRVEEIEMLRSLMEKYPEEVKND